MIITPGLPEIYLSQMSKPEFLVILMIKNDDKIMHSTEMMKNTRNSAGKGY